MPNSEYTIRGIPSQLIERMWEFALPYIKRALDHAAGEIAPDDLKRMCLERDGQLWLVSKGSAVVGAATTEIIVYPHKKHCRVITVAGSGFDGWIDQLDTLLCDWAASIGCDAMEAHVRKGFVPTLAKINYKHLHSVVIKKLEAHHG
jgi:hypothetical protein